MRTWLNSLMGHWTLLSAFLSSTTSAFQALQSTVASATVITSHVQTHRVTLLSKTTKALERVSRRAPFFFASSSSSSSVKAARLAASPLVVASSVASSEGGGVAAPRVVVPLLASHNNNVAPKSSDAQHRRKEKSRKKPFHRRTPSGGIDRRGAAFDDSFVDVEDFDEFEDFEDDPVFARLEARLFPKDKAKKESLRKEKRDSSRPPPFSFLPRPFRRRRRRPVRAPDVVLSSAQDDDSLFLPTQRNDVAKLPVDRLRSHHPRNNDNNAFGPAVRWLTETLTGLVTTVSHDEHNAMLITRRAQRNGVGRCVPIVVLEGHHVVVFRGGAAGD